MYEDTESNHVSVLGDNLRGNRNVYLKGTRSTYGTPNVHQVTKVAPAPTEHRQSRVQAFELANPSGVVYEVVRPMGTLQRVFGIFPVSFTDDGGFSVSFHWLAYSAALLLVVVGLIVYGKLNKKDVERSAEGRFEEAVIDYLFTVHLAPIIICPLACFEARKLAKVFNEWVTFEKVYEKISHKPLGLDLGNRPLLITISLPVFSCATMVVTHLTMGYFQFLHVIPYCYINTITFLVGGAWAIYCDIIGKLGLSVSDEFEEALKNVGPSSRVSDYRAMWMLLSKLTRDTANAVAYTLIFLCLHLFLIITLTIYGLLSKIQDGFGQKDIGLAITAFCAIILLFFICDEAHYASNCVRVQFQKKLLLVELSWMSEEAQQEINMFLRATEMNPTDMSLDGFFDVNRTLFKSLVLMVFVLQLIATMVTYLVVLLQFQISIPEDSSASSNSTAIAVTSMPPQQPQ